MTAEKMNSMLVIGGCRSGKSAYALGYCNRITGNRKFFLATSVPSDEEMHQRVAAHQRERGPDWTTIETPLDIDGSILRFSSRANVILVDCLTLWISNLMAAEKADEQICLLAENLGNTLGTADCPVVLVSNEVGYGIVPDNPLARRFRDTAGRVNQIIARHVNQVVMTVAGIPVPVKPASIPMR